MHKIITNPTPTTQWQTLVSEASHACKVSLSEDLESYLVFLLMRFIDAPQMAQKLMGIEFLTSTRRTGSMRTMALRDVGDQCLLYSGFFPERARRRRVRVSYYVNIGKSAYLCLAESRKSSESGLFLTLADKFVPLMDILQSMREINNQNVTLDPMLAEEIWHDTGSDHALQVLQKFTASGTPIYSIDIPRNKH